MAFPTAPLLPGFVNPAEVFVKVFSYEEPQQGYVVPLAALGGNVNLAAGSLPATTESSGSYYTGLNAGATISQFQTVVLNSSGAWVLSDANGAGLQNAIGLAAEAGSVLLGELKVLKQGLATLASWTWTPGLPIYNSATPGGLTQTAPSTSGDIVKVVGTAITATTAYFDFSGTGRAVP